MLRRPSGIAACGPVFVMAIWVHAAAAAACVQPSPQQPPGLKPPELSVDTVGLIELAGYRSESYEVETLDGYILSVFRVLPRADRTPPAEAARAHRTPILMTPALASTSEQWVWRMDEKNITYQVVDQGFDVWLANYRGSVYGQRHKNLTVHSRKFWDFSWHENGVLDMPVLIDFVLAQTGFASLLVLGHSLSSTAQLVLLSERPEYAAKVRASLLCAPPVYFRHTGGTLKQVGGATLALPSTRNAYTREVPNDVMPLLAEPYYHFCYQSTTQLVPWPPCLLFVKGIMGQFNQPIDYRQMRLAVAHYPNGASIRQFIHYCQNGARGKGNEFRQYNFSPERNILLYGEDLPPKYNLSKIASPVYIYYGNTDALVNPKDVALLAADIPTLRRLYRVPSPVFNHIDFLMGTHGIAELYQRVIDDLNEHVEV